MTPALEPLVADGPPGEAEILRFVESHQFPIVENSGVTFVFRGEVEEVLLQHWVYGLPSAQPLQRIEGTDLWFLHMQLPDESRLEYKYELVKGPEREWILDPWNPRMAHDPFGTNSVCHSHGYQRPEWTFPDSSARQGSLDGFSLRSRTLGGVRHFRVYVPARFRRRRRYPLLLVHDGEDFLRYAQLKTVLDNLIGRYEVAPLIAVFLQPGDRLREYGADDRHARFLADELVPALERKYPLLPDPAARGLMGASFGAVASLFAATQYPGLFGRLLLQSGSFAFADIGGHKRGREFDPVAAFDNRYRRNPARVSERVFVSCGTYEPLIYENRSLIPQLQRTGMDVRYVETRDGHNWENWRDRCRDAFSWLFPGPLWMMYE